MEKLLTITIPSYNVEKYLETTIPTFIDDEVLDDIEILIVNDGSRDNTAIIGEKLQKQYPGTVFLINKENGGHGSTINKGIELATGKYFKVVDGDDWVDKKEFIEYIKQLRHLDVDVVMTPFKRVNEITHAAELKTFDGIEFDKEYKFNDIIEMISLQYNMHGTTFKTELLKKMRKISEHCFYVDQEYIIYPIKYVETVIFINHPIYQYRVGNNEQSMSLKNMQKNRNMHKRVTGNAIDYLINENLSDSKKSFLENRVRGLCLRQVEIYLSMDTDSVVKQELMEFLETVKTKCPYIYRTIPGKKMMLLRCGNCALYPLVSKLVH